MSSLIKSDLKRNREPSPVSFSGSIAMTRKDKMGTIHRAPTLGRNKR